MAAPDTRRLLTCIAPTVALVLAGCGSGGPQHTPAHTSTAARSISASDGATAIFRADVTPILCHYTRDVAKSTQLIAQASSDAGGAVNASAPGRAQAEYASALALYASVLNSDHAAFVSVRPPVPLDREYRQFLESLNTISQQASQLAQYAHARDFTAIANEQNLQTPTAGQQVFREAGITSCAAPAP